jgi:hypothetical protein
VYLQQQHRHTVIAPSPQLQQAAVLTQTRTKAGQSASQWSSALHGQVHTSGNSHSSWSCPCSNVANGWLHLTCIAETCPASACPFARLALGVRQCSAVAVQRDSRHTPLGNQVGAPPVVCR